MIYNKLNSSNLQYSIRLFTVAFEQASYILNVDEERNLTCEVADIPDWSEILLLSSDGEAVFQVFKGGSPTVNGVRIGVDYDIQDSFAIVNVVFDPVMCNGQLEEVYTCAVRMNDTWINDTTTLIYERKFYPM